MDKFLKYFENKQFVQWVLSPDEELNSYWRDYYCNNPSEKSEIELARLLVLQFRSKKDLKYSSDTETVKIFSEIVEKLEDNNKRKSLHRVGLAILKYTAVALLFFSLGIIYFHNKPSKFAELSEKLAVVQDQENSQLILGNGKKVTLLEKKSEIEYRKNGNIVINKQDTVLAADEFQDIGINQLIVPFGRNSSVKLPDGTVAYLNAGSRLVYPARFEGDKREVFLFGEGFFDVTHNAEMPFVVITNELEVEVLGTKFNLSAYPSDNIVETVLVEGKVKIMETGFHILKNNYILEPNQQATYNRESAKTEIRHVNVMNYVTWHEGFLNFESSDLILIIKKLERYYNIKICLQDPMMGVRIITGKLELKEEKERVLQVLANTASAELIKLNQSTYELK